MLRVLAGFALALAASSATPAENLAGRYYAQFPDGLVTGERYTGENIVEIVPVARDAAYFRIHLDYANGHSCGIYGVARAAGERLIYRDPQPSGATAHCVLSLARDGKALRIDDGDRSCSSYCGARGTLSDVTVPFTSKRPITYLSRLKASQQYRVALQEWRTGRPKMDFWQVPGQAETERR